MDNIAEYRMKINEFFINESGRIKMVYTLWDCQEKEETGEVFLPAISLNGNRAEMEVTILVAWVTGIVLANHCGVDPATMSNACIYAESDITDCEIIALVEAIKISNHHPLSIDIILSSDSGFKPDDVENGFGDSLRFLNESGFNLDNLDVCILCPA
ncbi:MAG: hypothetical protein JKX76_03170 [Colwellia sp.]|nr:hypothetical protein [Colwellia sp.]